MTRVLFCYRRLLFILCFDRRKISLDIQPHLIFPHQNLSSASPLLTKKFPMPPGSLIYPQFQFQLPDYHVTTWDSKLQCILRRLQIFSDSTTHNFISKISSLPTSINSSTPVFVDVLPQIPKVLSLTTEAAIKHVLSTFLPNVTLVLTPFYVSCVLTVIPLPCVQQCLQHRRNWSHAFEAH